MLKIKINHHSFGVAVAGGRHNTDLSADPGAHIPGQHDFIRIDTEIIQVKKIKSSGDQELNETSTTYLFRNIYFDNVAAQSTRTPG